MKKEIRVFKFGGASLKEPQAVQNVADILKRYKEERLVIVVSAMGKTTNALEKVVEAHAKNTGEALALLHAIRDQHYQMAAELLQKPESTLTAINDLFVAVEWVLDEEPHENYDFMYDQIVSVGELVSSRIVADYLSQQGLPTAWVDARDIIITDDIYREGWVQWEETEARAQKIIHPILEKTGFALTQGFIGSTRENNTTTLGREGSDYTAAIFSYCLNAEDMTIWKDVPGVLTGDPRLFENVTKLDRLSYKEAIEMTYYGATVIHPKTIKPIQNKSIPLFVKSFINPDGEGTCISADAGDTYPPIVTVEKNQALLLISTRDFSFVAEHHISQLFQYIADKRLQVNMMQNSAISFGICVNDTDDKVDRFIDHVTKEFKVTVDRSLELISVRHFNDDVIESLRAGKILLQEGRTANTIQMVVKNAPVIRYK